MKVEEPRAVEQEPSQSYRERFPVSLLRPFVSCVWIQQVASGSSPYFHLTVPNGSAELVCMLGELPKVVGPHTGPVEETLAPGTAVVGVRFHPGAAPAVLGLPSSEIVDLAVGAEELWGRSAVAVADRMSTAASPRAAAEALEDAIVGRLPDATEPDPIAEEAVGRLLGWRSSAVASLASSLYVSERQLRRRCEAATGLAPKVLHRMLRFQRFLALTRMHEQPAAQLARLAREAGYADQAHLSREALRLAGRSPRVLLHEGRECRATHDHTASFAPVLRALRQPHPAPT